MAKVKIDNLICSSSCSLLQVMEGINNSGFGIVFCVDSNKKFVGTLSDGDIRRAILAGVPLQTTASEILNPKSDSFRKILEKCSNPSLLSKIKEKPICANYKKPTAELMKIVNETVTIIPLLNDNDEVVDYFEYKAHFNIPIASSILGGEEINNVLECLETNWISSQGRFIAEFEELFCKYTGAKYAVSVMNGTAALSLALAALNIGKGDEVIVPDLTFAATINSVIQVGATPVIVDVNLDDWCISLEQIKKAVTSKTKGIIPVHLYGYPCDMKEMVEFCQHKKIHIIEDVAEALGAEFDNKKLGTLGVVGCFSFFGNKVITTGEGGMCTTNDENVYKNLKIIRDHGMSREKRYWHIQHGFNYRMTNMQAAVGCGQIKRINQILEIRKNILEVYLNNLNMKFFTKQMKPNFGKSIVWLVSLLLNEKVDKEKFIASMKEERIDIRPFFYPLSEMDIYKDYVKGKIVNSTILSKRGVNLPTLINLTKEDYELVCAKINKVLDKA